MSKKGRGKIAYKVYCDVWSGGCDIVFDDANILNIHTKYISNNKQNIFTV
jgi:ribulose 1,5-bisphosphate carboxylase large subunit-like protein